MAEAVKPVAPAAAPPAPVVTPAEPATPAAPPPAEPPKPAAGVKAEESDVLGGEKKVDDKSKDGGKPDDKAPPADVEIKFPEGFKANDALVAEFKGAVKELGLKSEQAQKFADFYVKAEQARAQQLAADAKAMRDEWKQALKADKEIGGEKYAQNVQAANQAFEKFAGPELKAFLKDFGLLSHPAVVKHFHGLAKRDAEPGFVPAGSPGGSANTDEARFRASYPTMFSSQG